MSAILPPATLGVLGGGQLGRYFVMAARTMGYRTVVLEPDRNAPAGAAADLHLIAAYDDPDALATLAASCAAVTSEFENPPAHSLERLAEQTIVRPSSRAIQITQDRRLEKRFLVDAHVPVGPFAVIEVANDLDTHGVAYPAILKTARFGYDGKGHVTVADATHLRAAWTELGEVPCVLEQRLAFDREISVVLTRGSDGDTAVFPVADNTHVNGILDVTMVPAAPAPTACDLAVRIAEAIDYVGVLTVEMFDIAGRLVVNELAPRPHNSGHWTLDGARTSQFEQQVRALCGLPLGDPSPTAPGVAMANLLGDLWQPGQPDWSAALGGRSAHLHLYGKNEARPGRKMGHITTVASSPAEAARSVRALRAGAVNQR